MRPEDGERFVEGISKWYAENGRHDLAWRSQEISAFQMLLAEVMLQKTSAEQVAGVFEDFVESYPDPESLLEASEEELAEEIAPLGLRKRASHMRKIADQVSKEHGGEVPNERDRLLELQGVGSYTADSVLAHAHREDAAPVDTNVSRVLSRAFPSDCNDRDVEVVAGALVPSGEASDFVHALIDLGSAICTPSSPNCDDCPVSPICDTSGEFESSSD